MKTQNTLFSETPDYTKEIENLRIKTSKLNQKNDNYFKMQNEIFNYMYDKMSKDEQINVGRMVNKLNKTLN